MPQRSKLRHRRTGWCESHPFTIGIGPERRASLRNYFSSSAINADRLHRD